MSAGMIMNIIMMTVAMIKHVDRLHNESILIPLAMLTGKTSPFNDQCSRHIETSQLICSANQLTGFYMMGTLVVKGLI